LVMHPHPVSLPTRGIVAKSRFGFVEAVALDFGATERGIAAVHEGDEALRVRRA
jgi:hypothetical protein